MRFTRYPQRDLWFTKWDLLPTKICLEPGLSLKTFFKVSGMLGFFRFLCINLLRFAIAMAFLINPYAYANDEGIDPSGNEDHDLIINNYDVVLTIHISKMNMSVVYKWMALVLSVFSISAATRWKTNWKAFFAEKQERVLFPKKLFLQSLTACLSPSLSAQKQAGMI